MQTPSDTPPAGQAKLRRALTTPLVTLYGLGVTVGAGIYVLVGAAAAEAGVHAPLAFLAAAIVVAFTAFSYAELSTRYPVSAGEAAYVEAGFRSGRLAMLAGAAVALSGVISASAVSLGAAGYLEGLTGLPQSLLAVLVVLAMGGIALWGITQSVTVAAVITVIEVLGLVFVIGWGFGVADPSGAPLSEIFHPQGQAAWLGIASASILAFFAFVGFEDMANVAEEVKDPVHTMPRAILLTLVIATLLYMGTTTAVLVAVPLDRLVGSSAPLMLVFDGAGAGVRQSFGVIAIVATVNGVLIQMIMASRVIYGLADRGHLPAALAYVAPRTQTPVVATLAVVVAIIVLSQTLPIGALAERTSQIVLCVFALVNLALIRLKSRPEPDGAYFRVPLAVPVLGLVTSAGLLGVSFL